MKNIIQYCLLCVAGLILFIFGNNKMFLLLLLLLLLLPAVTVTINLIVSRFTTSYVNIIKHDNTEKETDVNILDVEITVNNSSFFPAMAVEIDIRLDNSLTGSSIEFPYEASVGPRKTKTYTIQIESVYCGYIDIDIVKSRVKDLTGIAKFICKANHSSGCYVYPDKESDNKIMIEDFNSKDENNQYTYKNVKGNDITEILNLRDYQKGDSIKSIHWKLSKKIGKKIIKELNMPISHDVLVLLALSDKNINVEEMRHRIVSKTLGIAEELLSEELYYDAILISSDGFGAEKYSIEDYRAKELFEKNLLRGNASFDEDSLLKYLKFNNIPGKYSRIILVGDEESRILNDDIAYGENDGKWWFCSCSKEQQ